MMAIGALCACLGRADAEPLKVYILAGQSNMEGHAAVRTFGDLARDPATAPLLAKMRDANGAPRVCERVWISYLTGDDTEKHGKLTAGYGALGSEPKIGPEFTFGLCLQELTDGPILLIKTAWGGKSLNTDFRPPSAGPYQLPEKTRQLWEKHPQGAHGIPKAEDRPRWQAEKAAQTGVYYRRMIEHVKKVLADPGRVCSDYDPAQGYEIAGFIWFQGWNDMCDSQTYPEGDSSPEGFKLYTELLAHFIRDVRRDLGAPEMPFVIGTIGVGGHKAKGRIANLRAAMAATADLPEFRGRVAAVDTAQFWDEDLAAVEPRQADLHRLQDSAHLITREGLMEPRKPGLPDWEPVGRPAPEEREWRYVTFDAPPENDERPEQRERKRFRDIAPPAGWEDWYQPGFDDRQWKRGRAPIGKGVWRCPGGADAGAVRHASDWGDGEFILMRTTFKVDRLDDERYRLSILAREGFDVYLNGHKIHTYTWWQDDPYYRSIRLEPEQVAHLRKGVNVLAACSMAHRDKTGEPYASIDLAIEGLSAQARAYVDSAAYLRQRMDLLFTPREQQLLGGVSNGGYHYLGSAKILGQIGKAFAEAVVALQIRQ